MEHYSLFLDEIHPGGHFDYFCLAGVIIKTTDYSETIIPEVEKVKQKFFAGSTSVIIHEKEISDRKTGTPFAVFQDKSKREEFWTDIKNVLLSNDIKGLAVAVHQKNLYKMYPGVRDKYFLSLQLIVENFVHFLESVNGRGDIYVESTNPSPHQTDDQLQSHYYYLKANGTLFYDRRTIQHRLGNISFPLKADNIIGLQLADLIPNSLNRKLTGYELRTYGLVDAFEKISYDGCCGDQKRFGIKLIP
ncbi:DUF3800 domain-containing protein [Neobacillus jeddahensis]|uniref:DUF3800 domain-containing protein n=1 Tax=Neobacillus jeddahensis TaxID=1461580 RepID=UPI0005A80407|nr:DUF3800 domain-containing protein [Neobacillus jeddahensis]